MSSYHSVPFRHTINIQMCKRRRLPNLFRLNNAINTFVLILFVFYTNLIFLVTCKESLQIPDQQICIGKFCNFHHSNLLHETFKAFAPPGKISTKHVYD